MNYYFGIILPDSLSRSMPRALKKKNIQLRPRFIYCMVQWKEDVTTNNDTKKMNRKKISQRKTSQT